MGLGGTWVKLFDEGVDGGDKFKQGILVQSLMRNFLKTY
jgi:hypothetical protein